MADCVAYPEKIRNFRVRTFRRIDEKRDIVGPVLNMPGYVGRFCKYVRRGPVSGERSVVVSHALLSSETLKDDFCIHILKIFSLSGLILFLSDITNILNVFTICKFFDHFFAKICIPYII